MGPWTSVRSNMLRRYFIFTVAASQGRNSVSLRRYRVEFRATVMLMSLALQKPWKTKSFVPQTVGMSARSGRLPCQAERVVNQLSSVHQRKPLEVRDGWKVEGWILDVREQIAVKSTSCRRHQVKEGGFIFQRLFNLN